jgi:hypothetical protein
MKRNNSRTEYSEATSLKKLTHSHKKVLINASHMKGQKVNAETSILNVKLPKNFKQWGHILCLFVFSYLFPFR